MKRRIDIRMVRFCRYIRPDRQVLVAALAYAAVPDGKRLAQAWQKYRTATVRDVLLGDQPEEGLIDLTGYTKGAHKASS